jgi:hypothetical protein
MPMGYEINYAALSWINLSALPDWKQQLNVSLQLLIYQPESDALKQQLTVGPQFLDYQPLSYATLSRLTDIVTAQLPLTETNDAYAKSTAEEHLNQAFAYFINALTKIGVQPKGWRKTDEKKIALKFLKPLVKLAPFYSGMVEPLLLPFAEDIHRLRHEKAKVFDVNTLCTQLQKYLKWPKAYFSNVVVVNQFHANLRTVLQSTLKIPGSVLQHGRFIIKKPELKLVSASLCELLDGEIFCPTTQPDEIIESLGLVTYRFPDSPRERAISISSATSSFEASSSEPACLTDTTRGLSMSPLTCSSHHLPTSSLPSSTPPIAPTKPYYNTPSETSTWGPQLFQRESQEKSVPGDIVTSLAASDSQVDADFKK